MIHDLHPHQVRAMVQLRASLSTGHRRPMLQAPTGAGKTVLAAAIVEAALAKGNRVTFTVPTISLIDQTVERFGAEGLLDLGVIQADHPLTCWWKPLQVASVQTLARRELPATDLVIVDEAHIAHKRIFQWMQDCPDLRFIGLSATPWTKGLGRHYDDLVTAATTAELIHAGFLSKFRVFAPSHPDLNGVHTVAGDYHEGELAEAMDKPKLVANVVETWLRLGENRPTLVFAVNRAHAHSLEDAFIRARVTTAYVDAFTDRDERTRIGREFNAGRTKVVVNVATMTTGVDLDVRCIVLARPTKSGMLYVQIIGRALRVADGKVDALVLDHSDSTLNLGFVDQIVHDKLDSGRPTESKARVAEKPVKLPRECPSCHFLKPAGVHRCPSCGFAPEKREEVATAAGTLVQVAGAKVAADHATKQRWWSGLLHYCQVRDYSRGWASHKYRDKFGVWPKGLSDTPKQPGADVANFVRSSQIRFAKRQEVTNGQAG